MATQGTETVFLHLEGDARYYEQMNHQVLSCCQEDRSPTFPRSELATEKSMHDGTPRTSKRQEKKSDLQYQKNEACSSRVLGHISSMETECPRINLTWHLQNRRDKLKRI